MTVTREAPAAAYAPDPGPTPKGGALARWFAGWRISLRMARRDIRRHVGRSLLVAVMVGLPVVVMVAGLTALATNDISVRESIPARMGSGQAVLAGHHPGLILRGDPLSTGAYVTCEQNWSTFGYDGSWGVDARLSPQQMCPENPPPARAQPIPGLTPGASLPAAMSALTGLTGGRLVPMATASTEVRIGKRAEIASVLSVDAADPAVRGMVDLTSGRWPSRPGEYVVTDAGERLGLPTSGTFELTPPPAPELAPSTTPTPSPTTPAARVTGTIVGTATAAAADTPASLVAVAPTQLMGSQFILDRTTPVTWVDVQRLNGHGLALLSRDVVENPDQAPPSHGLGIASPAVDLTALALLCLALLVESCLLAGPAFAVIAQRQRRSLALAAANGATRAQLRRTLLAQALVLGVAAAVAGLLLGILTVWVGAPLYVRLRGGSIGPFEVPLLESSIVLGCAVVASVVSALIPARGLTKLDVAAALRGDVVSPRPHRGLPVLGLLLFVASAVTVVGATVYATRLSQQGSLGVVLVMVGGVGLVIGALLLVPSILTLLGRATARMPVPVRMATRDAARQRGRATPTVAAIMAGAILLAGFGIAGMTTDEMMRREYRPTAPMGSARVHEGTPGVTKESLQAAVVDSVPGATVRTIGQLQMLGGQEVPPGPGEVEGSTRNSPVLAFASAPCLAPEKLLRSLSGSIDFDTCPTVAIGAVMGSGGSAVAPVQDLAGLYDLDDGARRTLSRGGIVVTSEKFLSHGQVTALRGLVDVDAQALKPVWKKETMRRDLPAAVVTSTFSDMGGMGEVLMTPQTAATLGATVAPSRYVITAPSGEITREQQTTLGDALALPYADQVYVERGYESPIRAWLLVAFISVTLLILVATLTSTALSMGEARRDLATLAAVGAPDAIRRWMSGVQAAMLALVGTILGLLVGAVPGSAFAWVVSARYDMDGNVLDRGYVLVPWLLVGLAVVLVPLLAALLAALFVRVRPDLTRRLS